jgi:hypothetical protein
MSKYGHRKGDWLEAIVNKLGGEEAGDAFLRGELTVVRHVPKWTEHDGFIDFQFTTDGCTGPDWITRTEAKGNRVGDVAKRILLSKRFKPTIGRIVRVRVLKGELFADNERYTKTIRTRAYRKYKLKKLNLEDACYIREMFTDKELEEMGLWAIIAMHDPVTDSDSDPGLLGTFRHGDGRDLNACYVNPGVKWGRGHGFAFALAQVSAQTLDN